MIGALMGIPGKLKTLLDRLTATRAGYLDNLSAGAVAQAGTALSTAQWTNTRAGYLDNIPSIPTTPINSIQYGEVSIAAAATSATATITSVTTSKTVLVFLGSRMTSGSTASDFQGSLTLTNSTTVTGTRQGTGGTLVLRFVAVEFK